MPTSKLYFVDKLTRCVGDDAKLRGAIVSACNNLDEQMIKNAFDAVVSWASQCLHVETQAFPNE